MTSAKVLWSFQHKTQYSKRTTTNDNILFFGARVFCSQQKSWLVNQHKGNENVASEPFLINTRHQYKESMLTNELQLNPLKWTNYMQPWDSPEVTYCW